MIGILGGTFDPIHFGHLRPALEVQQALQLNQIRFVPSRIPPHRAYPGAMPDQRKAMLALAIDETPGFVVDERELRRDGPSYTVDTLQSFREELDESPLCFLLGMDAFVGLHEWHRWREIPDLAHLVVAYRPHWDMPVTGPVAELLRERQADEVAELRSAPAGHVLTVPVTQLDISASGVRTLIQRGYSPRYLLPERVVSYIHENGLYRSHEPPN